MQHNLKKCITIIVAVKYALILLVKYVLYILVKKVEILTYVKENYLKVWALQLPGLARYQDSAVLHKKHIQLSETSHVRVPKD
jgi:hypothetical protein